MNNWVETLCLSTVFWSIAGPLLKIRKDERQIIIAIHVILALLLIILYLLSR